MPDVTESTTRTEKPNNKKWKGVPKPTRKQQAELKDFKKRVLLGIHNANESGEPYTVEFLISTLLLQRT